MSGLLKDDLTVALDEVDRTASRIVTIYDDLASLAEDQALAARLESRSELHRNALARFNDARRGAGQIPEVADPERAHLQSLWLALKHAVAGNAEQRLNESLGALDDELRQAIASARALRPVAEVDAALAGLARVLDPPQ